MYKKYSGTVLNSKKKNKNTKGLNLKHKRFFIPMQFTFKQTKIVHKYNA